MLSSRPCIGWRNGFWICFSLSTQSYLDGGKLEAAGQVDRAASNKLVMAHHHKPVYSQEIHGAQPSFFLIVQLSIILIGLYHHGGSRHPHSFFLCLHNDKVNHLDLSWGMSALRCISTSFPSSGDLWTPCLCGFQISTPLSQKLSTDLFISFFFSPSDYFTSLAFPFFYFLFPPAFVVPGPPWPPHNRLLY